MKNKLFGFFIFILPIGFWKVQNGTLVNKIGKKALNNLTFVKGDRYFTIRDNENPHRGICDKWELGEKTEGGWRSIIDVETGKYLTASSNQTLSSQGTLRSIFCFETCKSFL